MLYDGDGGADGINGCGRAERTRVYSLGPCGAGGAGGAAAGGVTGVANTLVAPLEIGACGWPPGVGAAGAPGLMGVPKSCVNSPGSFGDGVCGTGAGRLSSSPPGRDSGSGDWKKFVNSPEEG